MNEEIVPHLPFIKAYSNREARFDFRGHSYHFSLSHGLFSSADIDSGSRFLLKIFSNFLDDNLTGLKNPAFLSRVPPFTLLDAGSGIGVLGVCAAGALSDFFIQKNISGAGFIKCRAQDRDELATIFSAYNAAKNGISPGNYEAYTEPLLSGPPRWNLILSNIPAKAGLPVLEDFICRSARLLKKDGLVFLVVVNTLKDFFREKIAKEAALYFEETGKEHTVFVYGQHEGTHTENTGTIFDEHFLNTYPFYIRTSNNYDLEGAAGQGH
ncbi:MAG: methyltransferase, partial [Treponema sp.]|nr:methyltransferase [Treponema sp.]